MGPSAGFTYLPTYLPFPLTQADRKRRGEKGEQKGKKKQTERNGRGRVSVIRVLVQGCSSILTLAKDGREGMEHGLCWRCRGCSGPMNHVVDDTQRSKDAYFQNGQDEYPTPHPVRRGPVPSAPQRSFVSTQTQTLPRATQQKQRSHSLVPAHPIYNPVPENIRTSMTMATTPLDANASTDRNAIRIPNPPFVQPFFQSSSSQFQVLSQSSPQPPPLRPQHPYDRYVNNNRAAPPRKKIAASLYSSSYSSSTRSLNSTSRGKPRLHPHPYARSFSSSSSTSTSTSFSSPPDLASGFGPSTTAVVNATTTDYTNPYTYPSPSSLSAPRAQRTMRVNVRDSIDGDFNENENRRSQITGNLDIPSFPIPVPEVYHFTFTPPGAVSGVPAAAVSPHRRDVVTCAHVDVDKDANVAMIPNEVRIDVPRIPDCDLDKDSRGRGRGEGRNGQ
ncbi:hypothetical protein K435DRAFT_840181 [Dendrothele bispora CBS 962.96]|uniref:Uncharacterized protein n=1 Tax=Dendrothele bispora (strain CBS 962.96) TaxID=1314807 RepID=A0A4S8LW29_DENBC|nr:hypothetical protein K435DRAFT_840181 [Dendrothele bispora CBS 962.96]